MKTLTRVYQQNINVDTGDCFGACVASLTGLPIDTIPLFRGDGWAKEYTNWLFKRGFQLTRHVGHRIDKGYYIVGKDPFFIKGVGWRCHAVIYKQAEEEHNPLSNRSNEEVVAANAESGIHLSDILERRSGIVYTMVLRSINVVYQGY